MKPEELHTQTQAALAVTGTPEWGAFEEGPERDRLTYGSATGSDEAPFWALVVVDDEEGEGQEGDVSGECFAVGTATAAELIKAHLRTWLLDRGWQVQAAMHKGRHRWRLVDCLSISDGGGDRLDTEYPYGEVELSVLCGSVMAITENAVRTR